MNGQMNGQNGGNAMHSPEWGAEAVYVGRCCSLGCGEESDPMPTLEHVERWMVLHTAERHPEQVQDMRDAILRGPGPRRVVSP